MLFEKFENNLLYGNLYVSTSISLLIIHIINHAVLLLSEYHILMNNIGRVGKIHEHLHGAIPSRPYNTTNVYNM